MNGAGFQLANFVVITAGAGLMMIVAGAKKRQLHWKIPSRRCPSCGRLRRDCSCRH